jgi:hypothetical protein
MGRMSEKEKEKIKQFLKKSSSSNPLVSKVYTKNDK